VAPERFLARPGRALLLAAALAALVLLAAVLVPDGPLRVDAWWAERMRDGLASAPEHLARVFDWLGRGIGRALTLVAIGVSLLVRRRWLALGAYVAVEALTPLTNSLLKLLVARPRPPDGLAHPVGSSFPSGHASYAAATLVALVLLYSSPGPRRWLWWALALLGAAAMAWSRTYLQVHWLTDVTAGAVLGWAIALAVFAVAQLAASSARYASAFSGSMNHSK